MENKWKKTTFPDEISARVYGSRLLGGESTLVLHGGGNTSLKIEETDHTGRKVNVLRIKGSGSDLSTIGSSDFIGLRLDDLLSASSIEKLSDSDMLSYFNKSKLDPSESSPSVESFLHAFIPFKYVDHTHASAILSMTNSDLSAEKIKEVLGKVAIVKYVPPGFKLAKELLKIIPDADQLDGIVLSKHGLFTFSDDPKESYEKHIEIVSRAEKFLEKFGDGFTEKFEKSEYDFSKILPRIRGAVSQETKKILLFDRSTLSERIARAAETESYCSYGPATPDMLVRTKLTFLYIDEPDAATEGIADYVSRYSKEFSGFNSEYDMHDPNPSIMVLRGAGILVQSTSMRECRILLDEAHNSFLIDGKSSQVGHHQFISRKDAFQMEYWPFQEAKLKKYVPGKLQGNIAIVTGAASGIGLEAFRALSSNGSFVIACDIDRDMDKIAVSMQKETGQDNLPFIIDLQDPDAIRSMFTGIILQVGGIDTVFNNAGILKGGYVEDVTQKDLDLNYYINSRAPFIISQEALKIMKEQGIGGNIVFNITKNLLHPGPGMLTYGSSKAFAAQVCHYIAREGGKYGIRANIINPDKVFRGSKIWENGVLEARAKAKGQTVEEYKTQNLLRREVLPAHVTNVLLALLDEDIFGATTDTMIPVDGGVL